MMKNNKILFVLLFLGLNLGVNHSSFAITKQKQSVNPVEASQLALTNPNIRKNIQAILPPNDYREFEANLISYSAMANLKGGSAYYEARRNDVDFAPASGVVISPNGFYYIAYRSPQNNYTSYFTNDSFCNKEPHYAIKVLTSHYKIREIRIFNNINMNVNMNMNVQNNCENVYGNSKVKQRFPYYCADNICKEIK